MKLAFQIGKTFNEINQLTLGEHYRVQQEILTNPKPQVKIIQMLSGCDENEIYKLDMDQFSELWLAFEAYYVEQLNTDQAPDKTIQIGDKEYWLMDLQKITVGEFADLDIIVSSDNAPQRIHEILSVIYRPIKEKTEYGFLVEDYDGSVATKRAQEFLDLDLGQAMRALNFFLDLGKGSFASTLSYLRQMKETEKNLWIRETYDLIIDQLLEAGSAHWQSYRMKMSLSWTELKRLGFTRPLTGWPGSKTKENGKKEPFKIYKNYDLVTWQ